MLHRYEFVEIIVRIAAMILRTQQVASEAQTLSQYL